MAIQVRRGLKADFDPNKLLPGEFAAPLDTKELYLAYGAGDVKRMSTYEDMKDNIEEVTQDIVNTLTNDVNIAVDNANTKATYAQEKGDYAKDQGDYASTKGQEAQSVIDSATPILNQNLQATYSDKGTVTGKFINFQFADEALAQVNIKGATTVTPTNTNLPISPDNKATLVSAQNFDLVSHGKNYIHGTRESVSGQGITVVLQSDGTYLINGTASSSDGVFVLGNSYTDGSVFWLEKGTYTLKGTGNEPLGVYLYKTGTPASTITSNHINRTFTLTERTSFASISIRWVGTPTFTNQKVYLQLEKGETLGEYTPYKEDRINIPYEMGQWNDIIDGNYVKSAGENVFDGSSDESWTITTSQTTGEVTRFDLTKAKPNSLNGNIDTMFCDLFKVAQPNDNTDTEHIRGSSSPDHTDTIMVYVKKSRITGWSDSLANPEKIALFRTWLKSNNIKIRYQLATPTIITPLNTYLKTFKGVTNIFTNATPQPEITATFKSQLWADSYLKEKAIESKLDTNKVVDNDITNVDGYAWSAKRGKAIRDDFNALSKNLSSEWILNADLNALVSDDGNIKFLRLGSGCTNVPFDWCSILHMSSQQIATDGRRIAVRNYNAVTGWEAWQTNDSGDSKTRRITTVATPDANGDITITHNFGFKNGDYVAIINGIDVEYSFTKWNPVDGNIFKFRAYTREGTLITSAVSGGFFVRCAFIGV